MCYTKLVHKDRKERNPMGDGCYPDHFIVLGKLIDGGRFGEDGGRVCGVTICMALDKTHLSIH
ncbi:hypothetical protein HYW17_02935 [Candidatus Uhrbacteria bacterium]|nr:hypothetical protein [Candidatus Uhrbacteria bacterium]